MVALHIRGQVFYDGSLELFQFDVGLSVVLRERLYGVVVGGLPVEQCLHVGE